MGPKSQWWLHHPSILRHSMVSERQQKKQHFLVFLFLGLHSNNPKWPVERRRDCMERESFDRGSLKGNNQISQWRLQMHCWTSESATLSWIFSTNWHFCNLYVPALPHAKGGDAHSSPFCVSICTKIRVRAARLKSTTTVFLSLPVQHG
jgi:hypothetical protein